MPSKPGDKATLFFRPRTPEQEQAEARFSQACDELAVALDIERQYPSPESRAARRAAETAWQAARQARNQARNFAARSIRSLLH
jgi:hypothetical protein